MTEKGTDKTGAPRTRLYDMTPEEMGKAFDPDGGIYEYLQTDFTPEQKAAQARNYAALDKALATLQGRKP